LGLIPENIDPEIKQSPKHFTRTRKLPFQKLVTFILSLVSSGKSKGVDIKSGEFFKTARRSALWPEAEAVHRSAVTRARKKVSWTVFRDILKDAVDLAYKLWPRDPSYFWHGMTVIAIDGSKDDLPATEENRKEFDPQSGLDHEGRGHYPQCLVSTAYDVFRRLPVARTVVSIHGSEREEALELVSFIPPGAVLLFDRGYPSYQLICSLRDHYNGYFLFRCPAECTFPAVEEFVRSGRQEGYILLHPSNSFLQGLSRRQRKKAKVIQLRIIRLASPDGTVSVLLTNLLNQSNFPRGEIVTLYFRRWEVESYYRDEKVVLEIEKFHGKSPNSIRQELYAVTIMSVIARTLMVVTSQVCGPSITEFQFKNAIMTFAAEAAILAPDDPEKAVEIFSEILAAISRVKYYRPKSPRASRPRVTKRPPNKWCSGRRKKMEKA
jgi:Transposase DDE domain